MREVLARCEELRDETRGYFDVRCRRRELDPSGLVKGWSVDRAAAILDDARAAELRDQRRRRHARSRGGALPDADWRVGIQHPLEPDAVAAVVEATDLAVATSGEYARGAARARPAHGAAARKASSR